MTTLLHFCQFMKHNHVGDHDLIPCDTWCLMSNAAAGDSLVVCDSGIGGCADCKYKASLCVFSKRSVADFRAQLPREFTERAARHVLYAIERVRIKEERALGLEEAYLLILQAIAEL